MTAPATAAGPSWVSRWFDGAVVAFGLVLALSATLSMFDNGFRVTPLELISIPLIVLIARFPILLDSGEGSIEVGFDSCVLMFLLLTLPPEEALVLWSVGVVATQLLSGKRAASKRFNIGVGILAGTVSAVIITVFRGDALGTLHELAAVALGATGYFATDFLISAVSVALEERSSVTDQLAQPGTAIAVACFVPFDSLGYLGAVVARSLPWWTLALLGVPLITLLVATRAVTRGRENARRLEVLFEAAVRSQALVDATQVLDALVDDAQKLLRLRQVEVRASPPGPHEIGARLRDGQSDCWIIAPSRHRARSNSVEDERALEAMAAVSSDAFGRLDLATTMTHLAHHDLLTNLPNRGLLLDRLEDALQASRRRGGEIALLFCDLDGFKPVNDRFGHAAGDAVLVDIAQRLSACVREGDVVARLGGDEFAILLEDVRPNQVDSTCERILASIASGVLVAGHQVPLSASIGVALGDTGNSAEHLLRNADMAMYEAKALGKDQFVQYQRSLGRSRVQRLEMLEALRSAVADGDLTLVYQPLVAVDTGWIVGVEALARWTFHGVSVPPEVFIGAAEESGLVVALGSRMLDLAAADAAQLMEAAAGPFGIGVNISPQQLRDPAFVAKVEDTMAKMSGADLVLEITERDGVSNHPASLDAMARLTAQGVPFAIDDFGVGFSSIGYLQDMPVSFIKTDGSFAAAIDHNERACALLRSITMMAGALGLEVVVEGIERASQLDHLRDHVGAGIAQGFLLYRPMPVSQMAETLRKNRVATSPISSAPTG